MRMNFFQVFSIIKSNFILKQKRLFLLFVPHFKIKDQTCHRVIFHVSRTHVIYCTQTFLGERKRSEPEHSTIRLDVYPAPEPGRARDSRTQQRGQDEPHKHPSVSDVHQPHKGPKGATEDLPQAQVETLGRRVRQPQASGSGPPLRNVRPETPSGLWHQPCWEQVASNTSENTQDL